MSSNAWIYRPRDPLVFGDGRQQPALLARAAYPWPLPGMTAAHVRATLALDPAWLTANSLPPPAEGRVSREVSDRLLADVGVRGPWLLREGSEGGPPKLSDLWAAAPSDASVEGGALARGRLVRPPAGSGMLSPRGADPVFYLEHPHKADELPFPLWPLDALVSWALGGAPRPLDALGGSPETRPLIEESRVHVSLDDQAGTAAPEQLFTSSGLRWRDGYAIGLEVNTSAPVSPSSGLEVLGGESRATYRATRLGSIFPPFPEDIYAPALARAEGQGERLLRLQLLTPGCFGGWLPPSQPALEGLTLVGACVPRAQVMSGWNAQRRAPRAVRRLVPAGSVYWYRTSVDIKLNDIIRDLWGINLLGALPERETQLAPPHLDGFNQVLPGFTLAP